jgi:site-specific recombinase XerD
MNLSSESDRQASRTSADKDPIKRKRRGPFGGYAHATARENQLLTTDWGALSPIDLIQIGEIITECLADRAISQARAEAALAIMCVLVTGRKLADVAKFKLCPVHMSLSDGHLGLVRVGNTWTWHLSAKAAKAAKVAKVAKTAETAKSIETETEQSSVLIRPSPVIMAACDKVALRAVDICLAFRGCKKETLADAIPLFSFEPAFDERFRDCPPQLEEEVRGLLKGRSDARSSTTTIPSVERWLASELTHQPGGDRATADLFTGRSHAVSETPAYYGVVSSRALVASHARAISCLKWTGPASGAVKPNDGEFFGTARTPTLGAVCELARRLGEDVAAKRGRRNPVRVHNAMVRYTVAMIAFGTGLRPNSEVAWRFDRASGFAFITDKRVGDERTRIVPVSSMLREQLRLYSEHLDVLSKDLGPTAQVFLRDKKKVEHGHYNLPLFDLIDRDSQRAKRWTELWDDVCRTIDNKCPKNINRHYIMTHLAGNCSTESISAMLGHWVVGTEPWSRFSGLDPLIYKADLEPRLDEVLRDAGFVPRTGLARSRSGKPRLVPTGSTGFGTRRLAIDASGPVSETAPVSEAHRAEASPFNRWANTALPNAIDGYPTLAQATAAAPASRDARIGQMLASAIYNGALLDPKWFQPWIEALVSGFRSTERLWLEMAPPARDDPSHTYSYPRRWFADPVTELLIRRWQRDFRAEDISGPPLMAPTCLSVFCCAAIGGAGGVGTEDLLERAEYRWRLEMPGVLVSYAKGDGASLSVPSYVWSRIERGRPVKFTAIPADPIAPKIKKTRSQDLSKEEFNLLQDVLRLKGSKNPISDLRKFEEYTRLFQLLMKMNYLALSPRRRDTRNWGQKKPYASSTLREYTAALVKNIFTGDEADIEKMDEDDFDTLYRSRISDVTNADERNRTINAVNMFQAFMEESDESLIIQDRYEDLKVDTRVSTNIISASDFKRALEKLCGSDRHTRMLRILLMLAFRTGLRLPELLGLKISDLGFGKRDVSGSPNHTELYLRPNRIRRLKTEHSRRMLPLDVLLTSSEIVELDQWYKEHAKEASERHAQLLFASPGGGTGLLRQKITRNAIESVIRDATGDPSMRYEHLRHSFASYLLACLLLPSDDTLLPVPLSLGDDCISLTRRRLILDRIAGAERLGSSALHVVSQLCGHGPVTTTLRWYTHLLDWSVGSYVNRAMSGRLATSKLLGQFSGGRLKSDTMQRYDRKTRSLAANQLRPPPENKDLYRVPRLVGPHDGIKGEVQLAPIFASLVRVLKPVVRTVASTATGLEAPVRRRGEVTTAASTAAVPTSWMTPWVDIQKSVLALRSQSETAEEIAQRLELSSDQVRRWLVIADKLAGPRRAGEKQLPFQSKHSGSRSSRITDLEFLAQFPRAPEWVRSLDIVDSIWDDITARKKKTDTVWAINQYCRFFRVNTGTITFRTFKDSKRFYRWLIESGFSHSITVTPTNTARPLMATDSWEQERKFRKILQKNLPVELQDNDLRKVAISDADKLPRSIWVRVDAPINKGSTPQSKIMKINRHARYAVRFAFTMIAIAMLEQFEEPPRRRGPMPRYGAHA